MLSIRVVPAVGGVTVAIAVVPPNEDGRHTIET